MRAHNLIPVTASLLGALALGCAEALGPAGVAGTYALQRVAADPLPAELYRNEYVAVRVLSDTIRLRADGGGTISGVRESAPLQAGVAPAGPAWGASEVTFRVVDDRIEITSVCPINANCVGPPHLVARRARGGLRVDYALGARVPLFYARVADAP